MKFNRIQTKLAVDIYNQLKPSIEANRPEILLVLDKTINGIFLPFSKGKNIKKSQLEFAVSFVTNPLKLHVWNDGVIWTNDNELDKDIFYLLSLFEELFQNIGIVSACERINFMGKYLSVDQIENMLLQYSFSTFSTLERIFSYANDYNMSRFTRIIKFVEELKLQ